MIILLQCNHDLDSELRAGLTICLSLPRELHLPSSGFSFANHASKPVSYNPLSPSQFVGGWLAFLRAGGGEGRESEMGMLVTARRGSPDTRYCSALADGRRAWLLDKK